MIDREVKILLRKELRQLFASKSAVATSAILPVLMLGVLPAIFALVSSIEEGETQREELPPGLDFGLLGEIGEDPKRLPIAMLPLFVALVSLIVPTMLASHLLISERERRTLELLVALPVRIEQVLVAKFTAVIFATAVITVPFLAIHVIVLPALGFGAIEDVIALPVLLVCGLALSTSSSLLTSLLARDFRTANNVTGAVLTPCIFLTMAAGALLPGGVVRPIVIGAVYLIIAAIFLYVARKTITFERLLS